MSQNTNTQTVIGPYTETDLEPYNDICDQANTIIVNTDTSMAENSSQRRLLEFDALLTHIRCDAMPQIIQDSEILFLVQCWLECLHNPAYIELHVAKGVINE